MSRHVFLPAVLLLFVVMMCCGSEAVDGEKEPSSAPLFCWKDVPSADETVDSLGVPGLVKVGEDVFAVAEAQCKKGEEDRFTGISSQLLKLTDATSAEVSDANGWKTEALEGCPPTDKEAGSEPKKRANVSRPTAVVKGTDIYAVVGNYSSTTAADGGRGKWELLLVRGSVTGENSGKRIRWNDTYWMTPRARVGEHHRSLTRLIGGGGPGIGMKDGTLVFPVEATKEATAGGGDGKAVSLILHAGSPYDTWKLSKGMSDEGCSNPSVVERKGKLLMLTACEDGYRKVYESSDKGESWTEALGTLSRVWGNSHGRKGKGVQSGFITATIEEKEVMLVTLPLHPAAETTETGKGRLHLWLTDNTHVVDIGPVSGEDDDAAASSLLHKSGAGNEKLILLYEKKSGAKSTPGIVPVPITEKLVQVKEVVKTWKEVDKRVSQLCPSATDTAVSAVGSCGTAMPTDGLVGYLSGNFSDGQWKDEYLGVNATVKKGAAAVAAGSAGGVTFTGSGSWAEWPVGKQGQNQLYHFANNGFTLAATVFIHKVPKESSSPIPLMGAKMDDETSTVLLRLSYTSEKKWSALYKGETTKEHTSTWEPQTTYHVAIVLQNGNQGSVYIDGQRVGSSEATNIVQTSSHEISHFYIGGDGSDTSDTSESESQEQRVTVTNVLLYNRPLTDNEITALNTNKLSITLPEAPKPEAENPFRSAGGGGSTASSGSTTPAAQTAVAAPHSATKSEETQPAATANSTVHIPGVPVNLSQETARSAETTLDPNVVGETGESQLGTKHIPAVSVNSSGSEGTAEATGGGAAHDLLARGDGSPVCENRVLPLLFLLGLWGFAAV